MSRRKQQNPKSVKAGGDIEASGAKVENMESGDPSGSTSRNFTEQPTISLQQQPIKEELEGVEEDSKLVIDTQPETAMDDSAPSILDFMMEPLMVSEGPSSAKHYISISRRKSDRILPLADDSGRENSICPICRKGFSSKQDFTKHMRLHNSLSATTTSVNTCKLCDKILSSQYSLDGHMLVHSGERPFECRECGMAFSTNGNMHRHMRIHKKYGMFSEERFLKDGVVYKPRGKKKKLMPSRPSNKKFPQNSDEASEPKRRRLFLNKMDQFGNNSMPSRPELHRTTTTLFQRQVLNISTVRPVISVDLEASMTRCPCCHVKLFTIYGIVLHLRKHERERKDKSTYHCSVCDLSWPTISELEAHAKTIHRKRHSSAKETMGVVEASAKPRRTGKNKNGSGNPDLTSFEFLTSLEFTSHRFPLMEKLHRPTRKDKSHSHSHSDAHNLPYFVCDECGMCSVTSEQSKLHSLIHDARRVASGSSSADSSLNEVNIQEHMEEAEFMLMFDMQVVLPSAPESMEEDRANAPAVAEQMKAISILKNPKNLQFDANQNVVSTADPNVVKVNLPSRPVASGSGNSLSDIAKVNFIQLPRSAIQETVFKKGLNIIQQNNSNLPSLKLAPQLFSSGNLFRVLSMAPSGVNSAPAVDVVPLNVAIPGTKSQSRKKHGMVLRGEIDRSIGYNRFNFTVHSGGDIKENLPMDLSVKASSTQRESFKHLGMAASEMETNPPLPNHTTLRSLLCSPFSLNIPNFNESQHEKLYRDYYNAGTDRYHCPTCGVPFEHGFKLQFHMQSHAESRRDANTSKKRSRGKQTSQKQFLEKNSTDVSSVKSCTQNRLENNKVTLFEPNNCIDVMPGENSLPVDRGSQPKVVRINESSLEQVTKKKNSAVKRNSYADSPHKLSCCLCPRTFPWISSLKRHILTHTGQKPFKCSKCKTTFSTKSNRERHMIRMHGQDVHDPATRQMMDRPYKCHLCVFSSFASSGKLMRHYTDKHPDKDLPENLAVGNSSGFGDTNASFNEVNRNGELNTQQDGNDNEEDDDEDEEDVNMDGMNEADSIALEMMTAENMAQAAAAAASAVSASHQALASTSSSQQLMNTFNFDPILANSLMTPGSRLLNVKATSTIPRPTQSGTPDKQVNPERDNNNVDRITECWKCRKTFVCRKTLLRHLKEHSIDLPFKCYLCDASFDVRLFSLEHKMASHPSDWSAVQDKNKVGNLKDYSEFMDRIVEDTLAGNTTRRIHEGMDLDMKPDLDYAKRKVFCSLCPKRFWSLQDLRRHMRSHTGERPFECDICRARFTLKHSMTRHRRTHTDPKAGGKMHSTSGEDGNSRQEDNYTEEEINNPKDLVLLEKENECVFAAAEQVRASNLTLGPAPDSFMNCSLSEQTDLLQNLLGMEDSFAIDQMLDSPNTAATLLGIHMSKEEASTA